MEGGRRKYVSGQKGEREKDRGGGGSGKLKVEVMGGRE